MLQPLPPTSTRAPGGPPWPTCAAPTSYLPPCFDFCYCLAKKRLHTCLSVSVVSVGDRRCPPAAPSRPISVAWVSLSRSLSTASRHQVCALVFLIGQTLINKAKARQGKASGPGPSLSGPCQPGQPPRLSRSHIHSLHLALGLATASSSASTSALLLFLFLFSSL